MLRVINVSYDFFAICLILGLLKIKVAVVLMFYFRLYIIVQFLLVSGTTSLVYVVLNNLMELLQRTLFIGYLLFLAAFCSAFIKLYFFCICLEYEPEKGTFEFKKKLNGFPIKILLQLFTHYG